MIYEMTWISHHFAGPHHLPLMSSVAQAQWAHNSVALNLLIYFYIHLFNFAIDAKLLTKYSQKN